MTSVNIIRLKQAAAILVVIIVIAIPISVFYIQPVLKVTPIPGVSVFRTVFANLVSGVLEPVPTNESTINENQVYTAATEFLKLESWLQSTNYTVHDEPSFDGKWNTGFSGGIVHGDIHMNPLSGKVLFYRVFWEGDPPFTQHLNSSDILDKGTIEQCAVGFLTRHNYTLSPYAQYSEPTIEKRYTRPDELVYKIRFHNVVSGVIVSERLFLDQRGSLYLYLDPQTGTVLDFSYVWTHIPNLPVHRAKTIHEAEAIAIRHKSTQVNISSHNLVKATLVFERIGGFHNHNYFLAWALFFDAPGWDIHVDAISGEILFEYDISTHQQMITR